MERIKLSFLLMSLLGMSCPALATLSLVETNPIGFGLILPNTPDLAGKVSIAKTNATRMVVSGNYVFAQTGTSGRYTITGGNPYQSVNVSIASGTIVNGGGQTLVINNFTTNTDTGTATGQVTLDASGEFTLQIGCDLTLGANQTAGNYTGTVNVILNPA